MLRFSWRLGLSLLIAALTLPVSAQDGPSQQQLVAGNELLQAGKAAYSAGRLAEALNDFEQAYQRLQRSAILYRIGDTADKLGDHERAVSALQQYLEAQPGSPDREFIESRIRANLEALQIPRVGNAALSPQAAANTSTNASTAPTTSDVTSNAGAKGGRDAAGAWWLWAGAGTLAVAGIIVAAVLVGSSSTRDQSPVRGNVGGVVQTLGAP
jgi:tetratricopeptide (TPR) repeat protein